MSSKRSTESLVLERNIRHQLPHTRQRTYGRRFFPQSWHSFQRMRCGDYSVVNRTQLENLRVPVATEMPMTHEIFKGSTATRKESTQPSQAIARLPPVKHRVENGRWASSWANHRAKQTMLTRNGSERISSSMTGDRVIEKLKSSKAKSKSTKVPSQDIELNAKAAEMVRRLKSIYLNDEERDRRLQSIRERMNEFQTQSIRKEVNKHIQQFNTRLKEDEKNRKELRRLREKFSETKKSRLKKMHVSRKALETPSVSRLAYGLPREGKEFSVSFLSTKTTDEIKELWRMAIVRKNCIDSFLNKVSQRHQDLPDVTVKTTTKIASSTRRNQMSFSGKEPREDIEKQKLKDFSETFSGDD